MMLINRTSAGCYARGGCSSAKDLVARTDVDVILVIDFRANFYWIELFVTTIPVNPNKKQPLSVTRSEESSTSVGVRLRHIIMMYCKKTDPSICTTTIQCMYVSYQTGTIARALYCVIYYSCYGTFILWWNLLWASRLRCFLLLVSIFRILRLN